LTSKEFENLKLQELEKKYDNQFKVVFEAIRDKAQPRLGG